MQQALGCCQILYRSVWTQKWLNLDCEFERVALNLAAELRRGMQLQTYPMEKD